LHELRNDANRAALAFEDERRHLTQQLDDLRHDYAELLMKMEGRIAANTRNVAAHDVEIAGLKNGSASGAFPALTAQAIAANTKAVAENTAAVDENTRAVGDLPP
jgi:hypothetical protein